MKQFFTFFLLYCTAFQLQAQVFAFQVPAQEGLLSECFSADGSEAIVHGNGFLLKWENQQTVLVTVAHILGAHNTEKKVFFQNGNFKGNTFEWKSKKADTFSDLAVYQSAGATSPFAQAEQAPFGFDFSAPATNQAVKIQTAHTSLNGKVLSFGKGIPERVFNNNIIACEMNGEVEDGFSGAPLLNAAGKVIGIVVAHHAQKTNIAYVIGGEHLKKSLGELITQGHISRPFLGIEFGQRATDKHPYIRHIIANSPASQKGLKEGAEVTTVNGKNVNTLSDVLTELDKCKAKQAVTLNTITISTQELMDKNLQINGEYQDISFFFLNQYSDKKSSIFWVAKDPPSNLAVYQQCASCPKSYNLIISAGTECKYQKNYNLIFRTWDDLGEVIRACMLNGKITIRLRDEDIRLVFEPDEGRPLLYY